MELKKIKELVTVGSGDLIGTSLSAIFWFFLASQIEPNAYGQLQWFIAIHLREGHLGMLPGRSRKPLISQCFMRNPVSSSPREKLKSGGKRGTIVFVRFS